MLKSELKMKGQFCFKRLKIQLIKISKNTTGKLFPNPFSYPYIQVIETF